MGNSIVKESTVAVTEDIVVELQKENKEPVEQAKVVIVTGKALQGVSLTTETRSLTDETESLISGISDYDFAPSFRCKSWNGKARYSDMIQDGLRYLKKDTSNVVMLFESPSTSAQDSSFYNGQVYKFHDWPPAPSASKGVLGPCRYSMMNGSSFPSFLRDGAPPAGLMEHWEAYVPGYVAPRFVAEIKDSDRVYAYLPVESIENHVNDPHVHYHLVGKDALPLMTQKTTKLLNSTKHRPCIAKTTHSMGSKGIFVIQNDEDEAEFNQFLQESGNPTFVITEFVEIERNVACHFFIHPNGEVTWIGSNENHRNAEGKFTSDSHLIMKDQDYLREIQLPFVKDVVAYCQSLGFWGFCGIDVLFDKNGKGHLVDLNPRVTGSCPSLMVAQLLREKYGFEVGLFRRSGHISYFGSPEQLFKEVAEYNSAHEGVSQIVIFSVFERQPGLTSINIGVYGNDLDECMATLNHFGHPKPADL